MKNKLYLIAFLFLNAHPPLFSQNIDDSKFESMCKCLDEIDSNLSSEEIGNLTMNCILPVCGRDQNIYYEALKYGFYNCPNFVVIANDKDLLNYGIDTIKFVPPTIEECSQARLVQWGNIQSSSEGTYSITKDSIIEHYENNQLESIWKITGIENCITNYVVTEKYGEFTIPPLVGDNFSIEIIGISNQYLLSKMIFGKLQLSTVSIKLE